MAIPELRMSTTVVPADWLPPDDYTRTTLTEDKEAGPIFLNDTSKGLYYQTWFLTHDFGSGDFTVTPETTGSPVVVLNVAGVSLCSLCFDQNGHINIAYMVGADAYLYWYDTLAADWITTQLDFGVVSPTLTLDDKRDTQSQSSDILLWYTKEVATDSYSLFHRMQRDRFLVEYEMLTSIPPYIHKLGMHRGLRVQVGLSDILI